MHRNQFYCVKCQKKVTVDDDNMYVKTKKTSKRTINMLKSKHASCKCNLTKFVKTADVASLKKKYGTRK